MIDPREFETLIAELLLFLQESAAYAGDPFAPILLQASGHLHRIYQRVQRVNDRFVVAVVGLSNVGKSTLINALLGDQFSPARNGPCTASPVEFASGTSYRVTAYPRGDFRRKSRDCQSPAEVQRLLDLYVDQPNGTEQSTWERVVVELEHPLLQHGLVLADTPGFGAAQVGDQPDAHSQAVRAYLQHSVAQVFWVVFGEQGIGQRERAFYQEWLSGLCDDVVVTAREEWDDRDKSRFLDRYRTLFVDRMPAMHFVGHATELQTEPVADRIRELQTVSGRLKSSRLAFAELVQQLGRWLSDLKTIPGRQVWRPDSWWRLSAAPSCSGARDKILKIWEKGACLT